MRLGIQHQRITPGTPSENGAHERMHRSLKRRAIRPARATMAAQQRVFNAFRAEYNDERLHESQGMESPASRYAGSPRPYPARVPVPEYPGHYTVKRIYSATTLIATLDERNYIIKE